MTVNNPLLLTKLNRPRVTRDLVVRPHLLEQLDRSLDGLLTLVCAPPGFGKTTLVSSWVEDIVGGRRDKLSPLPAAWLTLDQNDSDLTVFVRYLVAALRTIFNDACVETLALIQGTHLPPIPVIAAALSNEIETFPGEFILVLDDYSAIQGEAVHDLLNELLRFWPQPMHLVLISRGTPPLSLANLRAQGKITDIRSRDLRFDRSESVAFLERAVQAPIQEPIVDTLDEKMEGWIGGLRLAALSMRSRSYVDIRITNSLVSEVNLVDYLMGEILSQQFPVVQKFLLVTSILDSFRVELCEAVLSESDPAWGVDAILDWLVGAQLFIVPLDNRKEWYRYHHLFQDFLKFMLSIEMTPDQIKNLHCRAATWFEHNGLIEQALQHALLADDRNLAARLMVQGLRDVLNREDRQTLERWLSLLPEDFIESRPGLLMIKAWTLQFAWQPDAQEKMLEKAETLIEQNAAAIPADELHTLHVQILVLKGQAAYFRNRQADALSYCREALARLPESWSYLRSGTLFFIGLSLQASGDGIAAERMLLDDYEAHSNKSDTYALRLLMGLSLIYLKSGALEKAHNTVSVLLARANSSRLPILQSWGRYFLGVVHYYWNELDAASAYFSELTAHPYTSHALALRDGSAGLALIHQSRGEHAQVKRVVEQLNELELAQKGALSNRTLSLLAKLKLLQGDMEGAFRWVNSFTDLPSDSPITWLEEPQLTRVRILLASSEAENVRMAHQILDRLDDIARRTYNVRFHIEVLTLRALAFYIQDKLGDALPALQRAIGLGRPGGFVRVFVELGRPMYQMLVQLAEKDIAAENIQRLLAEFPALQPEKPARELQSKTRIQTAELSEPLTRRELEILTLLREPVSIKQVAHKLDISPLTVKRHSINIYSKLGVSSRWDAVARAVGLGLLPTR